VVKRAVLLLLVFNTFSLAACPAREKVTYAGGARFRTAGDRFEISTDGGATYQPFFAKGVNLAISTPGHLPGELFATLEDYGRWLARLAEMNCNVVRAYTLHHPPFYAALGHWNETHPAQPIYLVQGIWLDELEEGDYMTDGSEQLQEEIAYVVDAIHGEADVPERLGKAFGYYRHDISNFVMAWLPGHEMDGEMVKESNKLWAPYTHYDGQYLSSPEGQPIESWVARGLDTVVTYEMTQYGAQRPVGWSNWPALDPIHHPTETNRFGQDAVDVDFGRFQLHAPFNAGLFVSYHVYPFNPEFIIYDPQYVAQKNDRGQTDSYLGYLLDLKAHHRGLPLFITEYGLPSSFGVAHINASAFNHGGYTEQEQAIKVVDMFHSIIEAGAAGAVVFELIDEWFKRTWMTTPTTLPEDRARLWYDVINPEESFGLISYYPLADSPIIDGNTDDWKAGQKPLAAQSGSPLASGGDGHDAERTITALYAAADPAFLFLRLQLASEVLPDLAQTAWYIGISTLNGPTGDSRFPDLDLRLSESNGLEAMVILDEKRQVFELRIDEEYDPGRRLNGESKSGGLPVPNDNGSYILSRMMVNNNEAYLSAGKPFVPEIKYYQPGLLRRGNSSEDTLSHYQPGPGVLELRLPWHALWVTDPSSRQVLADDPATEAFDSATTPGLQIVVASAAHSATGLKLVDVLPRAAYAQGRLTAAELPFFSWETWDEAPLVTERPKPLFSRLGQAYGETP
jgi:hypothetical protein